MCTRWRSEQEDKARERVKSLTKQALAKKYSQKMNSCVGVCLCVCVCLCAMRVRTFLILYRSLKHGK
jgi:hypothetical protein